MQMVILGSRNKPPKYTEDCPTLCAEGYSKFPYNQYTPLVAKIGGGKMEDYIPMIVGLAGIVKVPTETATTLLARDWKGFSTYGSNGVLYVKEATNKGYAEAYEGDGVNFGASGSHSRRGRVGRGEVNTLTTQAEQGVVVDTPCAVDEQNEYVRKDGCVGTLTTDGSSPKHNNRVLEKNLRIRKLTPTECWRLQGFCYPLMNGNEYVRDENGHLVFDDSAIQRAKDAGVSNSALYKQAGNAVSVNISEVIGIALAEWEKQIENTFSIGGQG